MADVLGIRAGDPDHGTPERAPAPNAGRAADNYHVDGGIKSKHRSQKYGEVFTPKHIVDDMLNMLQDAQTEDAYAIEKTFLEPCCGTGNFLAEILSRKFDRCRTAEDALTAVRSVHGMEFQRDNVDECRERLYRLYAGRFGASEQVKTILENRIAWCDALVMMKLCAIHDNWDACLQDYEERFACTRKFTCMEAVTWEAKRRRKPSNKLWDEASLDALADICSRYAMNMKNGGNKDGERVE